MYVHIYIYIHTNSIQHIDVAKLGFVGNVGKLGFVGVGGCME